MRWIVGGVTAARGFAACGISAGIKRGRKPDLALVVSTAPATAAAVFTRNRVQAAPVLLSSSRVRRGSARAVLINSGCANCLTGRAGLEDARRITGRVAQQLGIPADEVLVASTGLIGRRLPVPRVLGAIPRLVAHVSRANHAAAAQAILTTDLRIKEAAVQAPIGGRLCRLGGMAKGAGMLAPSLATMLCVITTDAQIAPGLLRALLREAVGGTFNRVSIDGDMSTNDTVFALASGRSGAVIRRGRPSERIFRGMLYAVAERLSRLLVKDGEGVARVMDIEVVGARTDQEAQACARQIGNSPLVKTMLAGGDPNVGRIAAAVGASPARCNPEALDIRIGPVRLVSRGAILPASPSAVRRLLSRPEVAIRVDLHAGRGRGRVIGCDLTEEYVRINAGYAT